jgi:photosystem II stability/assembly factor-like uncharacterized protein
VRRWVYVLICAVVLIALLVGVAVWRAAASPHYYSTTVSLSVVAFPDPDHAWVAGDVWTRDGMLIAGGTIHATTSGGVSWRKQEFATDWSDPYGIAFANAKCGWVVGTVQASSGTIPSDENVLLATTDGGVTWKQQADRTKYSLTGVACVSASHAWAVGGGDPSAPGNVVLVTTDGGASWRQQHRTRAGDLWSIAFADARHGWAVGDGVILATTDGGASWRQQGSVKGCFLRSVACGDARSAWAVGSSASNRDVILATTDGGASWQVQYSGSDPNSKGQIGYSDVAFADALHGWVVGLDGTILATTDGGRTWKPQRSGTKMDLNGVAFADTRHGLVVGATIEGDDPLAGKLDGSTILRTTDGGATWQQ